jgi:hypothetical protein
VCYLVDLQQTMLVPFLDPHGPAVGEHAEPLPVDSTLAGRAYQHVEVLSQQQPNGRTTAWLPLLDGTERLGVLAVTVEPDRGDPSSGPVPARLRFFASLVAELITTKTLYGDTIVGLRRRASMGLAAEMQWSLLPPLTFASSEVTVAAALEPAYEVAGDTVDYAVDAGVAQVAIFDGMGHGLQSAQLSVLAVSTYRHARRRGRPLAEAVKDIDDALLLSFSGTSFTTAVLAELDTGSGVFRWVNAGHPEPLLIRHGRLVKSLHVPPRPPMGIDLRGTQARAVPTVGVEQLEPGDSVLLYTDGIIEARSPDGSLFGQQRLVDLIVRNMAAGLPAPETMRRVIRALLSHQQGHLNDDATLLLLGWRTDPRTLTP